MTSVEVRLGRRATLSPERLETARYAESADSLKAEALQEASGYCAQEQKKLNVIHSKDTPAGFGHWAESEVEFTCESNTALTQKTSPNW